MATSTEAQDKTVTGYPAQASHVVAGYPAGTAYPYAVAPPLSISSQTHPPIDPTYLDHYYHRPGRPTLLCRLIIAFVALLSIVGLISFIATLVLKPHLPEFRVDSASVSVLNATRSELTATWVFSLFVKNTNHKLSIYYDHLQASVYYGDEFRLGTTQLPPFSQEKRNESTVRFQLSAISEYVGEDVVKAITSERDSGSVNFGVNVFAWVRFRAGAWRMRQHLIQVYCHPVKIGFSSNNGTGILMGQSRPCEVDL